VRRVPSFTNAILIAPFAAGSIWSPFSILGDFATQLLREDGHGG
jgi:hypothetical protein